MFKKGKERLPDRSVVEDGGSETQEAAQALMQCPWVALRTSGLPAVVRSREAGKGCTLNSCFRTISLVVGRTSRLGQKAVVVVQM